MPAHDRPRHRARPRGLDRGGDLLRLGRLELVLARRSPGVRVSGGYAHATTIPCGASSGRSVSASPRTAYFAGAYAE